MLRLFLVAGLGLMLCGCGPYVSFEPYEIENPLNLEGILGRDIVLLGPDTLALTVRYEPESQKNLITGAAKGDTFLLAWATRYRGLYYLTQEHKAKDTFERDCYLVHAMRVHRGRLEGLFGGHWQLDSLHKCVDAGQFKELIVEHARDESKKDGVDDGLFLRYDAAALHHFFRGYLRTMPTYRIVSAKTFAAAQRAATAVASVAKLAPASAELDAIQLYPNPARDQTTLTWQTPRPRTVQLLALNGQTVQTHRATAATLQLALDKLPAGAYVVRVTDDSTSRRASQRLVVQR